MIIILIQQADEEIEHDGLDASRFQTVRLRIYSAGLCSALDMTDNYDDDLKVVRFQVTHFGVTGSTVKHHLQMIAGISFIRASKLTLRIIS